MDRAQTVCFAGMRSDSREPVLALTIAHLQRAEQPTLNTS